LGAPQYFANVVRLAPATLVQARREGDLAEVAVRPYRLGRRLGRSVDEKWSSAKNPTLFPTGDVVSAMALGISRIKARSHRKSKSPRRR
jgi:hypothetical protein